MSEWVSANDCYQTRLLLFLVSLCYVVNLLSFLPIFLLIFLCIVFKYLVEINKQTNKLGFSQGPRSLHLPRLFIQEHEGGV